jgi:hypothetical protein
MVMYNLLSFQWLHLKPVSLPEAEEPAIPLS